MKIDEIKQVPLKHNINDYNILSFAFVGDAVWSMFVREKLVREHTFKVKDLHKETTKFVKAKGQSFIINHLILTVQENEIVKRGRNVKTNNKAKNASEKEYKDATSFETLLGYLKLTENIERLNLILNMSYDIIIKELME